MDSRIVLESITKQGDSPVGEIHLLHEQYPEYRGTGEILWETGSTICQG